MNSGSKFRMPAEWHRHSATQLHWPSNKEIWSGERLERVEEVYCRIIEELHFYEPVHLFVENLEVRNRVMQKLSLKPVELDRIVIHQQKINTVWARDYGPVFVIKGDSYVITDWEYNAWGEKYTPWENDNTLPSFIANKFNIKRVEPGMILEGGSIEVNGSGVLLTTESVLLNENRNPKLSQSEIENILKEYLGIDQIIWLKQGLAGDITDGHVDNITRWLNEDTVVTMVCEDPDDINYERLQENLEILRSVKLKNGRNLHIETLPLPKISMEGIITDDTKYVPASYASYYIANGVVIVPLYDQQYDKKALKLFRTYYKGRKVIGIPSQDLVWGHASIHGITQQWYGINTGA
ncbi:MAG: agmatine deiminase family protein [Gracilimonas sp.]|uniref:agmatine deiminase family protein n=1 Tax=Gracilimonas sp. TaxID=1974203 RepID=UPI0037511109|nr:agmatine deiminase family protein [Gracilimonas sp.]